MAEYNFQLKGWHAIVGVVAVLGYFGIQMALRVRPVDAEMKDAVREELLQEYSGRGPKDVARMATEAETGEPVEAVPEMVKRDVEFTSIGARGKMGGRVTLVRAEITVDGGPPPDGQAVRYFQVSRKFTGGWMVVGQSDWYRYSMELMP
ncbi:MAG TPA: hypothetical protein VLX32_09440 [Candidatus Acidoferrum sp.]|nr:hypothetical protein [Candidatus Acidoferrum sp.]